jgi:hypothetical protein
MANEISIYRGDTQTITVTVKENGTIKDLTSYTMRMTVKNDPQSLDAEALISKTATIAAPATGIGVFTLSGTDTTLNAGNYYYDVQINKSTTDIKTLFVSTFTILQDVTRTAT